MKKKLLLPVLCLSLFLFLFGLSPAWGQEEGGAIKVAGVNIHDAQIIDFSETGEVELSFDLFNNQGQISGIKYGVQLIENKEGEDPAEETNQALAALFGSTGGDDQKTQFIVDQQVYPEEVSLGQGQTVKKTITYSAPKCLEGEFDVWVVAKNFSGLSLGLANAGKIKLAPSDPECVLVVAESCSLSVVGETKQYSPDFGVDLSAGEKLVGSCDFWNKSDREQNFSLFFELFRRNQFGRRLEVFNQENKILAPGEKKNLFFEIPQNKIPQAYDAVLSLKDAEQKTISNRMVFHFVVQGESATIQNVVLNKKNYFQGEPIEASIFISSSADYFSGSRGQGSLAEEKWLTAKVSDGQNRLCANLGRQKIFSDSGSEFLKLKGVSQIDCVGAKLEVSVDGKNGENFDRYSLSLGNIVSGQKPIQEKINWLFFGFLLLALILLLWLWVRLVGQGRGKGKVLKGLVVLAGSAFVTFSSAQADTFVAKGGRKIGPVAESLLDYCDVVKIKRTCYIPTSWPAFPAGYLDSATCDLVKGGVIPIACSGRILQAGSNDGSYGYDATYTINFDKASYAPGGKVTISLVANASYCDNGAYAAFMSRYYASDPNGNEWKDILSSTDQKKVYKTVYETAPSAAGSYDYDVYGFAYIGHNPMDPASDTRHDMTIQVISPTITPSASPAPSTSPTPSVSPISSPAPTSTPTPTADPSSSPTPSATPTPSEKDGWWETNP